MISKQKFLYMETKKQFNSSSFCDELDKRLAELVVKNFPLTMDNFNNIFDQFINRIDETINKHAHLRRLSRKQQKLARKPWITKGVFTSIRFKHSIFRSHFIDGNSNEKQYFRRYTNILTKLKNFSKKLYFHCEFKKSQNNSHLTWKTILSVLPNKHNRVLFNSLRVNGTITDESTSITNEFDNFFRNIGAKLAKNINHTSKKKSGDYLTKRIKEFIFLKSPTDSEVMKEILSLNDKKAIRHDKIPALFLKIGRHVIAPYFNLFLQFIFNYGIYPNNWKIARVVPVYKK